jgi:hypothetical protein
MVLMRNAYKILSENPKGRFHMEDLAADVRIILKRVFNK